jgi:1,5-anhydro-D-fructose reductase (1,5-anhydro-D-mannitol-forming)
MKVGMAGLAALYWPMTLGKGLQARPEVAFVAAATLGVSDDAIQQTLGITPAAYAERFNVKLYESAEEMITAEGLDTVVLITRHTEHAAWVERLATLGVRLFIPKTFATTLADAQRIAQVQEQLGTTIAVGPSARFLPPFVAVKQALDEGRIGQPFALRLCHHHGTIDAFQPHDWYRDPAEGGPELSLGWYGIDLILHLMGQSVESVYAQYGNYTSPASPFMDCGRIELRLAGGALAAFDMYFCNRFAYPAWQLEILGPHGAISLHRTVGGTQTVVGVDSAAGYEPLPLPAQTPNWELFWVDDFLLGRPPAIDAVQAALITRISLAARAAAQRGQAVWLAGRDRMGTPARP